MSSNNLNGLVDSSYNYVIEPKYHWFSELENGFYRVTQFDEKTQQIRTGYVDDNGKEILPTMYRFAGPFKDSLAIVSVDGNQFILIDTSGNTISTFNEFISEKIDKDFAISEMFNLKKCLSDKERIYIYELINCRNTILPDLQYQSFTMTCGDSECYNKHEFSIFKSGYITKESYYEGSPNISIYLNSAELNTAIRLSDSLFTILGYSINDVEQTSSFYKAKFEKTWPNSRFSSKGEIRINCNSKECVLSPVIYDNY